MAKASPILNVTEIKKIFERSQGGNRLTQGEINRLNTALDALQLEPEKGAASKLRRDCYRDAQEHGGTNPFMYLLLMGEKLNRVEFTGRPGTAETQNIPDFTVK